MTSTSAAGTRTSPASSESHNASPSSSVSPSSSPSNANTAALTSSSSPSLFTSAPVTTIASSKQSQQPSSASRTTMSVSTVATTTAPTSASLSVPSSPIPTTSATVTPLSSSPSSVMTTTSSNDARPTTSTPESSAQSTTPPATTTSTATQSSASASPLTTSDPSGTVSSTPISAVDSTSNAPLTVSSSSSSSSSSPSISTSQSPSPTRIDMPLTTVLESTTVYITSTNGQGQVVTTVPPVVTEVITTTGSGGVATTVTQAVVNPTLAPDNNTTEGSSFFSDTGAVVGVFVVVGLASASIAMWILFAIRRRQRMRRFEQDTVIEAAVAAAGFNRAPLDDDDEADSPISPDIRRRTASGMDQRATLLGLRGSDTLPTSARSPGAPDDLARDTANSHPRESTDHRSSRHPAGYVPARTTSPSPRGGQFTDDFVSSRDRKSSYGHTPTYSAGSFEPLLANYAQNTSDQDASATEPPRNRSLPHVDNGLGSNEHLDESPENGSKPSLKRQNSSDSSVLRDENDYANYVLMVRNLPDDQSQHST